MLFPKIKQKALLSIKGPFPHLEAAAASPKSVLCFFFARTTRKTNGLPSELAAQRRRRVELHVGALMLKEGKCRHHGLRVACQGLDSGVVSRGMVPSAPRDEQAQGARSSLRVLGESVRPIATSVRERRDRPEAWIPQPVVAGRDLSHALN